MKRIPLTNSRAFALVDDDDYNSIVQHSCSAHVKFGITYVSGYITLSTGKQYELLMHRVVFGLRRGDGKLVDRKDSNGLNNTRDNLRVTTHNINCQNSKRSNSLEFRGVYKNGKGYMAQARVEGKLIYLGTYKTPSDAALAYDKKVLAVYGLDAMRNFNDTQTNNQAEAHTQNADRKVALLQGFHPDGFSYRPTNIQRPALAA